MTIRFDIFPASSTDKEEIIKILKIWNLHHALLSKPEQIDLNKFYVARVDNKIVGVAGYSIQKPQQGRTRLLAIYPEYRGYGIGKALQEKRLEAMYKVGIKTVETRSDRPETILWYKKYYPYREQGKIKKELPSGIQEQEYSTVLKLDLEYYQNHKDRMAQTRKAYIQAHDPHPMAVYPPLIINVALTGIVPTRLTSPHVPLSVSAIVEDAIKVHDAGASIVHIHARDNQGKPTYRAHYYEQIIAAIRRERPQLICCVTTSGRGGISFEERSEVLHLNGMAKPDMASLTLGSLNFLSGPSVNSNETVQRLALLMQEKAIKPELEVFHSGMIHLAKYMERHQIISGRKYFNLLMGNLNTAAATLQELSHLYSLLPENSTWAATGLGQFQLPINTAAIVAGGHVRVGLEDNIHYDNEQTQLSSNCQQVERIVRIAKELGRDIATPDWTRKHLDLKAFI